jgi:hypothetical protein
MGDLFDWLKDTVTGNRKRKPSAPAKSVHRAVSCIQFDGRSFPLAIITEKGLVATGFDHSLVKGQNARVTVNVDDACGRFSIATTISINEVADDKVAASWTMLTPENVTLIRQYNARKKAAGKG